MLDVPDGWHRVPLSSVGRLVPGGTPSRKVDEFWGGDIVWVTPKEVTSAEVRSISTSSEKITRAGLHSSSAQLIPKGSVLITSRASVGYVAMTEVELTTNQGFQSLVANSENHPEFFLYMIPWIRNQILRFAQGSTFLEISGKMLSQIEVNAPQLDEQIRIAKILRNLDEAIEETEAVISKRTGIKQGLFHDLMTNGIDDNGQIRNPISNPEMFVESDLGQFPDGWREFTLGELGKFSTSSVDKKVSSNETPVRLVNYMDVYRNDFIDDSIELMEVTATRFEIERSQVNIGDLLFTPSSETPDDICHCSVVMEELSNTLHSYHTVRLKLFTDSEIDIRFSGRLGHIASVAAHLQRRASGSTRYTLTLGDFESTRVVLPPIQEQRIIGKILDDLDDAIEVEREQLRDLLKMRDGLMDDLLSGRVRVPKFVGVNV